MNGSMKGWLNGLMRGSLSRGIKTLIMGLWLCMGSAALAADEDEMPEPASPEVSEQVNINQADAETLAMQLEGIGPTRAEAIVLYREENGVFSTLEELTMVRGVGEQTVMRNRTRITFD